MTERLPNSRAEAWLFWDQELGQPDSRLVEELLAKEADLWHAGLKLEMSGLPELVDFVTPTWMLNRDPDPTIEATSWRMSLRACLVRVEVLKQIGVVSSDFETLEGAALELGHRYIQRGVFMRHVPRLVQTAVERLRPRIPFADGLRFVYLRAGRFWTLWALFRAVQTGSVSLFRGLSVHRKVTGRARPSNPPPFRRDTRIVTEPDPQSRVSVLIPTIDRYRYLRTLLDQLRRQTVAPFEVLVVDQTLTGRRDMTIAESFRELPLTVLYRDHAGQCSSRNAGLEVASGEFILFLDDDDEVPDDLIASHLQVMRWLRTDVSSGVANEIGAGPLPEAFTLLRASDVFPTNNTLIRRSVLTSAGLFDTAYERGDRADGDLGMRVYLSGARMVLSPDIAVLHHHAPLGGLRSHKARVITHASSRNRLSHRHLPSVTEIYLCMRYFTPRQVREMLWLRTAGTFAVRGGFFKKALKAIISLLYLPNTLWRVRRNYRRAESMLEDYPQIPAFRDSEVSLGRF